MTFKVQDAVKPSVVLLAGTEDALRSRALTSMLDHLGVAPDDFDLEYVDADASAMQNWLASASTSPFLAERRIVVVRHLLRTEPSLTAKQLKDLPASSLLILIADSELANTDDRERKLATNRRNWATLVKGAGGYVEEFKIDPKELPATLKAEFQSQGKKASEKAVETLIEMTGGSLSRAMDEIQKLVLSVGSAGEVRESDVREIVVPSRDWSVFKLIDSVQNGAVPEALRQLRVLVGAKPKTEDAAIGSILPMFSRHFRLLWQARLCVEASCQPGSAPKSITDLFPAKPNLASESPFRQKVMMSGARNVSFGQISACLASLAATDARLKGIAPSYSAMETLDRLVLELGEHLARR